VPIITTIAGARATAMALKAMKAGPLQQVPLQQYFPGACARRAARGAAVCPCSAWCWGRGPLVAWERKRRRLQLVAAAGSWQRSGVLMLAATTAGR
jgi:hypothetical protein